jgi:hypothetical protein
MQNGEPVGMLSMKRLVLALVPTDASQERDNVR